MLVTKISVQMKLPPTPCCPVVITTEPCLVQTASLESVGQRLKCLTQVERRKQVSCLFIYSLILENTRCQVVRLLGKHRNMSWTAGSQSEEMLPDWTLCTEHFSCVMKIIATRVLFSFPSLLESVFEGPFLKIQEKFGPVSHLLTFLKLHN